MALFKILRGKTKTKLDTINKTDGQCYFVTDEKKLYIDYSEDDGTTVQRAPLNAADADTLDGVQLAEVATVVKNTLSIKTTK